MGMWATVHTWIFSDPQVSHLSEVQSFRVPVMVMAGCNLCKDLYTRASGISCSLSPKRY